MIAAIRRIGHMVPLLATFGLIALSLACGAPQASAEGQPMRLEVSWADAYASLDDMAQNVPIIVRGTVVSASDCFDGPLSGAAKAGYNVPPIKKTSFTFKVSSVLKGEVGQEITLYQTGCEGKMVVEGDPLMKVGDEYVLFLKKSPSQDVYFVSSQSGRLVVHGGQVLSLSKAAPGADVYDLGLGPMPFEEFSQKVKSALRES